MATLVFGVAGAAVGSFFGAPSLGFSIGAAIGGALFPANTNVKGPTLSDLTVTSSAYGQMIPIVYGTDKVSGNIIWSTPKIPHTKKKKTGGKGGPTTTTSTTTYTCSFALALCEGVITGVRRIWFNEILIYNAGDSASVTSLLASAFKASSITVYTGTETQLPNSLIQAYEGVSVTSGYRGLAYLVFDSLQLADYNNSIPTIKVEVVKAGAVSYNTQIYANLPNITTNQSHHKETAAYSLIDNPSAVRAILATNYDAGAATFSTVGVYDIYPNGQYKKINVNNYLSINTDSINHTIRFGWGNADVICALTDICTTSNYMSLITYEQGGVTGDVWLEYLLLAPYAGGTGYNTPMFFKSGKTLYIAFGVTPGSVGSNVFKVNLSGYNQSLNSIFTPTNKIVDIDGTSSYIYTIEQDTVPTTYVRKYDRTTYASTTIYTVGGAIVSPRLKVISDTTIYFYSNSIVSEVSTGIAITAFTTSYDFTATGSYGTGYNVMGGLLVAAGTLAVTPTIDAGIMLTTSNLSRDYVNADTIVSDIHQRAGLSASNYDVTALASIPIAGYTISSIATARANIEPILNYCYADAVESDGKIKYVLRGGSSAVTIPEDDLAAHEYSSQLPDNVYTTRTQEVDLPYQVTVRFKNFDASYEIGAQYSRRLITSSKNEITVDLPIVMTATKALEIASVLEYNAWQERNKLKIALSNKYAQYEPTDIISFSKGSINYTARITSKNESNGVYSLECVSEDITAYSQSYIAPDGRGDNDEVSYPGANQTLYLDTALIRDQDDAIGFYTATVGYFPGFNGAQIYRSADGATYNEYSDTITNSAIIGTCTSTLGNFTGNNVFDESNSLSITLIGANTLSGTTELNVLNGANACAVGSQSGGYELLQFKNATYNGADSFGNSQYTISGLLRGRRGTEWAISTHAAAENFVLLDDSNIYIQVSGSSEYGSAKLYKSVSFGQNISETNPTSFTNNGVAQECYAPVLINGGFIPAGDITINWTRRGRLGGDWLDFVDVPQTEATESYSVQVMNAAGTSALRTTAVTSATTLAYTAANCNTDFGYYPSDIIVDVYQNSATRGTGYRGRGTLSMPRGKIYFPFDGANGATSFPDSFAHTTTRAGSLQISTAQSKFGGSSCLFNGTTDYLDITYNNDLNIATNDFTFAFWVRTTSLAAGQILVDFRSALNATGLLVSFPSAAPTKIRYAAGDSDPTSFNFDQTGTTVFTTNTWYHIEAIRSGATFTLFVNGVQEITGTYSGYIYINRANVRLGAGVTSPINYLTGNMDDFLFINGMALHTANFTPPTTAYLEP